MTTIDNLTALEREQLRYIVERVPEWPEGTAYLWVTCVGCVIDDNEDWIYEDGKEMPWSPGYSPEFTRAQYDAMKAEMAAPAIDYRAHCAALALAGKAELLLYASENCGESGYGGPEPTPWDEMRAALTHWKEEGK